MSETAAIVGGTAIGAEASLAGADVGGLYGTEFVTPHIDETEIKQAELKKEKKYKIARSFSIPIIIAAALIFIAVIAWFESIRVWLEYAFNSSTIILFNKAIGDTIYAVAATIIVAFLVFLLTKFWIK